MSLWDRVTHFMALNPWTDPEISGELENRSLEGFSIAGALGRTATSPWRLPSIREALGVPAILRAVTLISNTAGALSMDGIRNGVTAAPEDRPRLIVRPNPLTTPRIFWRDTAYYKATRGEAWWWVARRDVDGMALSLVPIPPYEITVEANQRDARYPIIRWRNVVMPNEDMIFDTLMPDPDDPLRGAGPLQLCGAAISVAVEAQQWAANFYAQGGYPSIVLKAEDQSLDEEEVATVKARWTANPPNTPQVLQGFDLEDIPVNEQGAQMLNARQYQNGEVALMFGIPGSLLEFVQSGSSLTYQNVGQRFDDFVKGCLWPNYLEGSEQVMTDLLPRSWVARFDTDAFTRPDPKTRMEIHNLAITAGVYDAEYAQVREGIQPGSIETAPMPLSPPAALPPPMQQRSQSELRCDGMAMKRRHGVSRLETCNRLLSLDGVFVGRCPRCGKHHEPAPIQERAEPVPQVDLFDRMAGVLRSMPATQVNPVINVQPARAPEVRVEPVINVQAAPTPDVNIEPTVVNVQAAQAPDVRVEPVINVQAAQAPDVRVEPVFHVDAAPTPDVRVEPVINVQPADVVVNVDAPIVNVPKAPAPVVNVTTPEVNVTTPSELRISSMPARATRRAVTKRDRNGAISEVVDIEADAQEPTR